MAKRLGRVPAGPAPWDRLCFPEIDPIAFHGKSPRVSFTISNGCGGVNGVSPVPLSAARRRQSQSLAVFGHRPPGQGKALPGQQIGQGLVAVRVRRVLLPHQLGDAGLGPPGGEPPPHRPAKEPPDGEDPLPALEHLVPQGPAHRGGVDPQPLRQLRPSSGAGAAVLPPEKSPPGRPPGR